MAVFLLFSCRAAGMRILRGLAELVFRGEQNPDQNAAFLAVLRVLRSKTGKNQPGAALEHLELAKTGKTAEMKN